MSKQATSIPKGTRDFGPEQMAKRNYIFDVIKKVFQKFGFLPLETPSMENLSVLTGKYGDEGDKLLFKILNSGDFLNKTSLSVETSSKELLPQIAEKGLRYDLTVPFARYVVMNQGNIAFPFKRYQIQPVWRADRPQKGRYREFYQCDADVVGTDSLLCEAENILMINEVLANLGINDFTIKLNHRKILEGITEVIDAKGKEAAFCVAIDKLDKIGKENVIKELIENDFSESSIKKMGPFFSIGGSNEEIIGTLKDLLKDSPSGNKGIEEIEEILMYLKDFEEENHHVKLEITLARGLSYYTGAIIEVAAQNTSITSSIIGGGRYDNLTGVFGLEGVSGVGFSFGIERIYDILEEKGLFGADTLTSTKLLVVNFDKASEKHYLKILKSLRNHEIPSELYPDASKLKKQFTYADRKNIPFVLIAGPEELEKEAYSLKNMKTGEQELLGIEEIIKRLS